MISAGLASFVLGFVIGFLFVEGSGWLFGGLVVCLVRLLDFAIDWFSLILGGAWFWFFCD